MATSRFNSISEFTKNVTRGTFGISLVTLTVPKMNKRGNPFYGRVYKTSYLTNVALGYDYENTVNNHLERKGIDGNFTAAKSNGKKWFEYPYILQADKDASVKYLRCTMRPNTKAKSVFILDGKVVTDVSIETQIKSYIQKNYTSKKQAESGLDDEEQVVIRDYNIESVMLLKQGDREYRQINENINIDMIKNFFNK